MEISLDEIESKEEIKSKYEQGSLSLADFVHDQLRNIKVNLKKVARKAVKAGDGRWGEPRKNRRKAERRESCKQ